MVALKGITSFECRTLLASFSNASSMQQDVNSYSCLLRKAYVHKFIATAVLIKMKFLGYGCTNRVDIFFSFFTNFEIG